MFKSIAFAKNAPRRGEERRARRAVTHQIVTEHHSRMPVCILDGIADSDFRRNCIVKRQFHRVEGFHPHRAYLCRPLHVLQCACFDEPERLAHLEHLKSDGLGMLVAADNRARIGNRLYLEACGMDIDRIVAHSLEETVLYRHRSPAVRKVGRVCLKRSLPTTSRFGKRSCTSILCPSATAHRYIL